MCCYNEPRENDYDVSRSSFGIKTNAAQLCGSVLQDIEQSAIYSDNIHVFGKGEGAVAEEIAAYIDGQNPTVATYAKDGEMFVRVTAKAGTKKQQLYYVNRLQRNCCNFGRCGVWCKCRQLRANGCESSVKQR